LLRVGFCWRSLLVVNKKENGEQEMLYLTLNKNIKYTQKQLINEDVAPSKPIQALEGSTKVIGKGSNNTDFIPFKDSDNKFERLVSLQPLISRDSFSTTSTTSTRSFSKR
jgi:hypothetical protein